MEPVKRGQQSDSWLSSIRSLTGSYEDARLWRAERYSFAHRLGEMLVGGTADKPALTGPVVYGIWLRWGLLYVGQTTDAARRLRDLPIGESHHLANTFPPETWDRVVVICWPQIPGAAELLDSLDSKTIGLGLEHHLQLATKPLANGARRTTNGGWHTVNRERSTSLGARTGHAVGDLAEQVLRMWNDAAIHEARAETLPDPVRCIRPGTAAAVTTWV